MPPGTDGINLQGDPEAVAPQRVERAPTLWDDRYGPGSFERLLTLFDQPCVSFARIAVEFGVSRERVRQWHREFRPDSPTGQQRRERCRMVKARRRLLGDGVFLALRRRLQIDTTGEPRFELLPAADGFRQRALRVNGWVVALCDGRASIDQRRGRPWDVWDINAPDADFFFVWFGGDDSVLLPRAVAANALRGRQFELEGEELAPHRNQVTALGTRRA